jgi:hypothetical protein
MENIGSIEKRWNKSRIAYKYYQNYLEEKKDKFAISIVDLLFIKNFKGGNSTINEENNLDEKLSFHSEQLSKIGRIFQKKQLKSLLSNELDELKGITEKLFDSVEKEQSIDGFKTSICSALYNSFFPNLLPIIDRRVLIGTKIVDENNPSEYKYNQVIDIQRFYKELETV